LIATAPSSSGRITLSVPLGALPTAVLTAETMTASCMMSLRFLRFGARGGEIRQQIFDGVADHRCLALEQVVGVFDGHELFGLRNLSVQLADLFDRNQFVFGAVDDELRQRA